MPVSVATLSYWQSGRSQPGRRSSLATVAHLETVLGLGAGELVSLVGRPRPRGCHPRPPTYDALWDRDPRVAAAFGKVDTTCEDQLTRISRHDRVQIGPDRTERSVWSRLVLRAERDGVDRYVVMHGIDDPGCPVSRVRALLRCRVGRTVAEPDAGIVVSEMVLLRPLARGEMTVVEHEVVQDPPYPAARRFERRRRFASREYVLEVRFAAPAEPICCERYTATVGGEPVVEDLRFDPEHGLHVIQLDARPGVTGVRWAWP